MDKAISDLRSQMLVKREKVDVEEELRKLEKRDKKRRREMDSDSEEERKMDPTVRAIKRAERKRRGARRVATTRLSRSRSRSSGSSSSSESLVVEDKATKQSIAAREALQKTREQYEDLRADLL